MTEERQFQGSGECFDADSIAKSNLPLTGSSYTIEAWVQPEEVQPYESFGIVGWGVPAYSQLNGLIFFRGSNSLRNIWWQNDLQAYLEKPLADGKYHHVAAIWDGSIQRIFVDFEEVASRAAEGYNVRSKANFCVGVAWHQDGSRAHFRGKIKGLKIWNSARNLAPDVETVAEAASNSMEPSEASESTFSETGSTYAQSVVVDSFGKVDSHAYFGFEVQTDGCYMVEERHPHVDGKTSVPLAVEFGKGLQAHGQVNHADGRHGQWNYLASLLFFDGFPSGVFVPKEFIGKSSAHAFRFSHLGSSCHSPEAKVQHVKLEVEADLSNNHGLEVNFKANLEALLVSALDLIPGRLSVMHVSSESILADIMIRPGGPSYRRRLNEQPTAEEIATKLESSLQAGSSGGLNDLSMRICQLAGSTESCTVTVRKLGTMTPRVHFGVTPQSAARNCSGPSRTIAIIIVVSAAALLCVSLIVLVCCTKAKTISDRTLGQENYLQTEATQAHSNPKDVEVYIYDETASTATPASLEEGLANLKDASDSESLCDISTEVVAI